MIGTNVANHLLRSENYLITGIDLSGNIAREIYKNGNLARRVEIFLPEVGYMDVAWRHAFPPLSGTFSFFVYSLFADPDIGKALRSMEGWQIHNSFRGGNDRKLLPSRVYAPLRIKIENKNSLGRSIWILGSFSSFSFSFI